MKVTAKRKQTHSFKNGDRSGKTRNRDNNRQKQSTKSNLDPEQLIHRSKPVVQQKYESARLIEDLPIKEKLKSNLLRKGFIRPTEIQDKTLEALMDGSDLLGIAKTGTGKTGAFLIPIIHQLLDRNRKKVQQYALIVVPTRELALQVEEEFKTMTAGLKLYSCCFIGGTNINRNIHELRRESQVVIGTPGRLLDLKKRGVFRMDNFNTLVLDEYDRMLDMGFARDMDRILEAMENRRQTMLFSATYDKSQQVRISNILRDPEIIKVSEGNVSADHIEQDILRIQHGQDPFVILLDLLKQEEFSKVLVFDETKHRVKRLYQKLSRAGIPCEQIHGNKSQGARVNALSAFKEGKINVLVATDVAARGIDIDDISHVINYQVPRTIDSYIHRIGRTGRAGKNGKALTFVA